MTRKNPDRTAIRERLRPGEKHFRMLVDHAPDGIFITDAHGRYLEVNAAWCEMLGYSHGEILGMMISDVLAPDEAPRVASEMARLRDGDAVKSVWRFRRKDDSSFYGEVNGRQLADSRLVGYVRDISQRKRTELALENSRALLQSFVEHTPAAVAMLDKELRYVAVSRRWMHDYELGARDLIGQCHYDVFPEIRSMPQWQSVFERCLSGAIELGTRIPSSAQMAARSGCAGRSVPGATSTEPSAGSSCSRRSSPNGSWPNRGFVRVRRSCVAWSRRPRFRCWS